MTELLHLFVGFGFVVEVCMMIGIIIIPYFERPVIQYLPTVWAVVVLFPIAGYPSSSN